MKLYRKITDSLFYIGAIDTKISRFENIYPLSHGVSYNSYLLLDKYTCLFDTIDASQTDVFLDNIENILNGRELDYLVIHHMEPDHCANIKNIVNKYSKVQLVGTKKVLQMIKQFHNVDYIDRFIEVKDGSELDLGEHKFKFLSAPMVHWPEVMMSFEENKGLLFSADAFGSFNHLKGNIFTSELDLVKDWEEEIRRYYINIVGKFGTQVTNVLKKIDVSKLKMILSLHGPIYDNKDDIEYILNKYKMWSSYLPEEKGVVLCYASMYGNSEKANTYLAYKLADLGVKNIQMFDVSAVHSSYIIAKLHQYSHAIFTALSYYADLYHNMEHLLQDLVFGNYQNRTVGFITNKTWASQALKDAKTILESAKNIKYLDTEVEILSAPTDDDFVKLDQLAEEIANSLN